MYIFSLTESRLKAKERSVPIYSTLRRVGRNCTKNSPVSGFPIAFLNREFSVGVQVGASRMAGKKFIVALCANHGTVVTAVTQLRPVKRKALFFAFAFQCAPQQPIR